MLSSKNKLAPIKDLNQSIQIWCGSGIFWLTEKKITWVELFKAKFPEGQIKQIDLTSSDQDEINNLDQLWLVLDGPGLFSATQLVFVRFGLLKKSLPPKWVWDKIHSTLLQNQLNITLVFWSTDYSDPENLPKEISNIFPKSNQKLIAPPGNILSWLETEAKQNLVKIKPESLKLLNSWLTNPDLPDQAWWWVKTWIQSQAGNKTEIEIKLSDWPSEFGLEKKYFTVLDQVAKKVQGKNLPQVKADLMRQINSESELKDFLPLLDWQAGIWLMAASALAAGDNSWRPEGIKDFVWVKALSAVRGTDLNRWKLMLQTVAELQIANRAFPDTLWAKWIVWLNV